MPAVKGRLQVKIFDSSDLPHDFDDKATQQLEDTINEWLKTQPATLTIVDRDVVSESHLIKVVVWYRV